MVAKRQGDVYVSATWAFLRPPAAFQPALAILDAELTAHNIRHDAGDLQLLFVVSDGGGCRFDELRRVPGMTIASVSLDETLMRELDPESMLGFLRFWMIVALQRALGQVVVNEEAPNRLAAEGASQKLVELDALGDAGTRPRRVAVGATWTFALRLSSDFATDEAERERLIAFEEWAATSGLRLEGHEIGDRDWTMRFEGRRRKTQVATLEREAARRGLEPVRC
jgi:hypothetical protein